MYIHIFVKCVSEKIVSTILLICKVSSFSKF